MDTLADALNAMKVGERSGKASVMLRPASKVIKRVLEILKEEGYVEGFSFIDDGLSGKLSVQLEGKINECRVVKPRFAVKNTDWEKWEGRFLPAKDTGVLIVSTSKGIMTHSKAKNEKLGGRLLAYIY